MRVLVVGDSFIPVATFRESLSRIEAAHHVAYLQLDETLALTPTTTSERAIREYAGTPEQVIAEMDEVEALIVHGAPVTDRVLDASRALRLVGCARGGPVNVDVAAASKRRLPVVNTPGKNADAVAELVVGFLVMLARRLPRAQRAAVRSNLGASAFEGAEFIGRELSGSRLGLVGFGQVGRRVSQRARALGMDVIVSDPFVTVEEDGVLQVDSLTDLLTSCDFVSIHVRETDDNAKLIGPTELASMRPGAGLVNTARASLVDEDALDHALASGHLGGAALDVVGSLSGADPHPLLRHDNVVITPHVGGATHETLARGVSMLADELERMDAQMPLRHVVNGERSAR